MNKLTIKRKFMEFPDTTITWPYKSIKEEIRAQTPHTVTLCNIHGNEERYGLNLKIHLVICTDRISTQKDINIYVPILSRIIRVL